MTAAWKGPRGRSSRDDECRPGRLRSHEQGLARCRQTDRRHRRSSASSISTPTGPGRGRANIELNGVAIGTNLDAVLDQTRPDAVFDVVVPAARRDVAFSAFAHHCHLLTEKPLADSPENARAIVEARPAGRAHPCRRAEPPLSSPMSGASGAFSIPARSARRPASMPTSSSRRISAASARRCVMCCCSTWRSIRSTPPATW